MTKKGITSSEFWFASATMLPWLSAQLGIDLAAIAGNADSIVASVAQGQNGISPWMVFLAIVYTVCRTVSKWKNS